MIKKLRGTDVLVVYYNGQIVAAANNGKLTIMNESLGIIKEFDGTKYEVEALCSNATYSVICDSRGSVQYYKKDSDLESKVIPDYRATSIQVKNNLLLSNSWDKIVQVWNMERHEKLWEFDTKDEVWSITLRDDQVIICGLDKSIRILALESGQELHHFEHPCPCYNADFNPNKSVLAVASQEGVVFWDVRNAVKIEQFEFGFPASDLRFNPSGDKLIVGLSDGRVFKFNIE